MSPPRFRSISRRPITSTTAFRTKPGRGVEVQVGSEGNGGSFAYSPAAIRIDAGTTVTWNWTGEGGQHNVVHEDGDFESELIGEGGSEFQYTFEDAGSYLYACTPHSALGMKGAVTVE